MKMEPSEESKSLPCFREKPLWKDLREIFMEARETESAESYKMLKNILLEVMEVPDAVELLFTLIRKFEPHREEEIRSVVVSWIERTKETLERDGIEGIGEKGGFVSRTLADLYFRQGYLDQAKGIYEALIKRDPNNWALIREYEERFHQKERIASGGKLLRVLSVWAERIREAKGEVVKEGCGFGVPPGKKKRGGEGIDVFNGGVQERAQDRVSR